MDISTLKTPYYGKGISTNLCVKKLYFMKNYGKNDDKIHE